MKTRGDADNTPPNGEGVLNILPDHPKVTSNTDTSIQTKDNETEDNRNNILPDHPKGTSNIGTPMQTKDSEIEVDPNNVDTSFHSHDINSLDVVKEKQGSFETNDVSDNTEAEHRSLEQESNLDTTDVSEALSDTAKFISQSPPKPNSPTRSIVATDAGSEKNSNQNTDKIQDSEFDNSAHNSNTRASPDLTEDKSSLPEVDSHINEHALQEENSTKLEESTGSIDDVDGSIHVKSNNFVVKDIPPSPSPSKEAYDNPAFVSDDISSGVSKVADVTTNVDGIPLKTISPDLNSGNAKLPRRVSFSELPPRAAVYDNLGFDDEKNGKVKDGGDTEKGQEIDFLAKYGPGEKWRIVRNVVLMSASFMVLFTAFFGAASLQSSVNAEAGLGTVSLTMVYGALIVSNIFLPVMVIRWLRCKWTVAAMALFFAPYAMAQFHAEFYTLIPTALLAGLGAGPMWCAKCTYLNVAADAFAKVTGSAPELVLVRFFGIFYVLFPLGHVWGNLISSTVLTRGVEEHRNHNVTVDVAAVCGANYCPGLAVTDNPNLQRPPDHQIQTIAAIFLVCSLLSVILVAVGVDNLRRYNEGGRTDSGTGLSGLQLLIATGRLLCNRNQLMLIPITAFIGVSQAFLGADFTQGYISCAWGIPHIGYVLIGYGLASSVASVFVSWVVKTAGRLIVICSSIALFLTLVVVLKFWQPSASQGAVFFLLAVLWGLADSTALVINAMYGLLFRGNEAAAYSNFSLWGSAGFIVTYSYSPYLCMNTKLAILAVILVLSLAGFITAEKALRRIIREQQEEEIKSKRSSGSPKACIKPQVP